MKTAAAIIPDSQRYSISVSLSSTSHMESYRRPDQRSDRAAPAYWLEIMRVTDSGLVKVPQDHSELQVPAEGIRWWRIDTKSLASHDG
jgi:hypothetical protein